MLKGDTWNGVAFEIIVNNLPMDLSNTSILMFVRYKNNAGKVVLKLSDTDGITITDADAGKFAIMPFICQLNAGTYVYDIQFTTNGVVKTYIQGTITVTQDTTY